MAALPPIGGSPPPYRSVRRAGARDEDPSTTAMQAQREASKQIEAAGKSVEEARHDADVRIDQIHDYYDGRSEEEYAREEGAFETQRLKGYERLKELKRGQEAEMSRTRRDGEREQDKISNYYRDTIYGTQREGDQKLREVQAEQGRSYEHALAVKNQDVEMEQKLFDGQSQSLREEHEEKLNKLGEGNRKQYEEIRENSALASEKAQKDFEDKYQARVATADETLIDLDTRASAGIRDVRRDTTLKLAAYSDRQRDPFYRMLDLNARLNDEGDYYELTATIPVHEQNHVSVAVKGEHLVLSGQRRSEEKLDIEPGHTQSTNAFQSYEETFPINWPVDANKLSRTFEDDKLTVRVPKKTTVAYHSQAEEKIPITRARLERPKFPENLPHVSQDPYAEGPDDHDPIRKKKGSSTLA